MPVNPLIALSVRNPDLSGAVNQFQNAQNVEENRAIRREALALRREDVENTKELRQAQLATAKMNQLNAREQRRLQSTIIGSARLKPFLDSGDIEGARTFLKRRRSELAADQAAGFEVDTTETDEALAMLDNNPAGLKKIADDAVMFGQLSGVLAKPENQEKFTEVKDSDGNIIGQRSSLTNKVVSDPRAKEEDQRRATSDIGKLLEDQEIITQRFGADSPQAKAIQEAVNSADDPEPPKLSDTAGIRKEFTKLSGDFIKVRDAIGRVSAAANDPSPAGDLALIFNFMKIQDPASVVRESEFATAQNAANLPGRIGAAAKRVVDGQRLTAEQRNDFVDTANRLFESQKTQQIALAKTFSALADRQGMNPKDVVVDFVGEDVGGLDVGAERVLEGGIKISRKK